MVRTRRFLSALVPAFLPAFLVAAVAATGGLAGCVPLLVGGAIVGTSMVLTDRRTSGAQVDDETIELKARRRIDEVIGGRGSVSVTSYNRIVLLTGTTRDAVDKATVVHAVGSIENVKSVVDETSVGFSPSISTRANDSLLTSKVKASLVDAKDVQSHAFKVVTERGVVYLMGRVTEREANRAADIARGVSGVQKVVKVFEIVTEAELNATQPKTPPAR